MYYAQLNNQNFVVSITETFGENNAPNMVAIDDFDTSILGYEYKNGEFVKPAPPAVNRTLPAGAFRLRFNFNERTKVELASVIDPSSSAEDQQTQATVKTFYADLNSQRYINLDSESVLRGCNLLNTLGILDTGWKARIIDPNPTAEELRFPG
jgi:hypothetical protein